MGWLIWLTISLVDAQNSKALDAACMTELKDKVVCACILRGANFKVKNKDITKAQYDLVTRLLGKATTPQDEKNPSINPMTDFLEGLTELCKEDSTYDLSY